MKKIARFLIWSFVFLVLLAALDQALLRVDLDLPGYRQARDFYLDFRTRVVALSEGERLAGPPATIEGVIESSPVPGKGDAGEPAYVYVDEQGELHFAETLEGIPRRHRDGAQKLAR